MALMTEYTQSESLRKHMLGVEASVRGYARLWGEPEEDWAVVALLHDFDYERWPDQENHPYRGVEILKAQGYPDWVTRAILSHAEYSGVRPRIAPGACALCLRRNVRLRDGVLRSCVHRRASSISRPRR